ncbi:MAG: hypothetical protein U0V49_02365 [Saprospiraceae bacterium]
MMTKQEFDQLSDELACSGLSIKQFMLAKGLPLHHYYYWNRKYNEEAGDPGFVPIHIGQAHENHIVEIEYKEEVHIRLGKHSPQILSLSIRRMV